MIEVWSLLKLLLATSARYIIVLVISKIYALSSRIWLLIMQILVNNCCFIKRIRIITIYRLLTMNFGIIADVNMIPTFDSLAIFFEQLIIIGIGCRIKVCDIGIVLLIIYLTDIYSIQPVPFLLATIHPIHFSISVSQVILKISLKLISRCPYIYSLATFFIIFIFTFITITRI